MSAPRDTDAGPRASNARAPATMPATGLPRSGALTDALLADPASSERPLEVAVVAARERLERGLTRALGAFGGGGGGGAAPACTPQLLRIGHYQVARALEGLWQPRSPRRRAGVDDPPFRWTAHAARRSIGLAALQAGLDGRAATPADGVALVMSDPCGPLGLWGGARPGSCADWVAALAPPARTIVAAEATAWATRLWTAVDWGRLDPRRLVVGAPDRWWRWTGACRVAVRGRVDVRLRPAADGRASGGTHLVVLDGLPGVATRPALLLSALVDALSCRQPRRDAPVPARVVGWWPDCGKSWIVPVDGRSVELAADAVVSTARALLAADATGT